MRYWMKIALAMVVALSLSDAALAKKPKKNPDNPPTTENPEKGGGETAAAPALEITNTGVADVDNVFQQAIDPLNNLRNARNSINSLNTNLTKALGLADGTPIADAHNDLKTKAEGKITMAIDEKGLPKLTPGDAVPQNVTDAINAVNQGITDVTTVIESLSQLPAQMKEIAAAAAAISPDSLINSGVKPLEAPKLMKTVNNNIKVVGEAPNELTALKTALEGTLTSIKSTFGG
jgi:hypothetical protein